MSCNQVTSKSFMRFRIIMLPSLDLKVQNSTVQPIQYLHLNLNILINKIKYLQFIRIEP